MKVEVKQNSMFAIELGPISYKIVETNSSFYLK